MIHLHYRILFLFALALYKSLFEGWLPCLPMYLLKKSSYYIRQLCAQIWGDLVSLSGAKEGLIYCLGLTIKVLEYRLGCKYLLLLWFWNIGGAAAPQTQLFLWPCLFKWNQDWRGHFIKDPTKGTEHGQKCIKLKNGLDFEKTTF